MHLLRNGALMARRRRLGADLLIYDSFTNGTGSSIRMDAHSSDIDNIGTGWVQNDPDFIVTTGGQALSDDPSLSYSSAYQVVPSSYSSFIAECYDAPIGAAAGRMTLRYIDENNHFYVVVVWGSERFQLLERASGVDTVRADVTASGATAQTRMWMADDGETLQLGYDRKNPLVTYSSGVHDTVLTVGLAGLSNFNFGFDDFQLIGGTSDPADLEDLS